MLKRNCLPGTNWFPYDSCGGFNAKRGTISLTLDEFKTLADIAESVATVLALTVGASWAYLRFHREREGRAKIDLTVDIDFLGTQNGKWLVHLVAQVSNGGKVRHWIRDFRFRLRALPAGSDPSDGDETICEQVVFPDLLKRGTWLPLTWAGTFIDPGVVNTYRHIAVIPMEVSFVLLDGMFSYADAESESHHSTKAFRVPDDRQLPDSDACLPSAH
jgi:hypothetical protein